MTKIDRDESFSVGDEVLDEQHKRCVKIFNNIHAVMTKESSGERNAIGEKVVKEMFDYTRDHFKLEEDYMHSIGYSELARHHRKHKDFDSEVYTL